MEGAVNDMANCWYSHGLQVHSLLTGTVTAAGTGRTASRKLLITTGCANQVLQCQKIIWQLQNTGAALVGCFTKDKRQMTSSNALRIWL